MQKGVHGGRRWYIMNLGLYPTAYVELKPEELEKSNDYNDYDFDVHYGFTFLGKKPYDEHDKTEMYIGWDYAHTDDYIGPLEGVEGNIYDNPELLEAKKGAETMTKQDIINEMTKEEMAERIIALQDHIKDLEQEQIEEMKENAKALGIANNTIDRYAVNNKALKDIIQNLNEQLIEKNSK